MVLEAQSTFPGSEPPQNENPASTITPNGVEVTSEVGEVGKLGGSPPDLPGKVDPAPASKEVSQTPCEGMVLAE